MVSNKRQTGRKQHKINKYRARYRKVFNKYGTNDFINWARVLMDVEFQSVLREILKLNVKYLNQILYDIEHDSFRINVLITFSQRDELLRLITSAIIEKTILK